MDAIAGELTNIQNQNVGLAQGILCLIHTLYYFFNISLRSRYSGWQVLGGLIQTEQQAVVAEHFFGYHGVAVLQGIYRRACFSGNAIVDRGGVFSLDRDRKLPGRDQSFVFRLFVRLLDVCDEDPFLISILAHLVDQIVCFETVALTDQQIALLLQRIQERGSRKGRYNCAVVQRTDGIRALGIHKFRTVSQKDHLTSACRKILQDLKRCGTHGFHSGYDHRGISHFSNAQQCIVTALMQTGKQSLADIVKVDGVAQQPIGNRVKILL